MRAAFLALGFIFGACATAPLSQIVEYSLDPISHMLRPEKGDDIHVGMAEGYKCFSEKDLKSMKRYIVDLEEQLKTCK